MPPPRVSRLPDPRPPLSADTRRELHAIETMLRKIAESTPRAITVLRRIVAVLFIELMQHGDRLN